MLVGHSGRPHGALVSTGLGHFLVGCANLSGFYLITTDILGPYGSGFAMGTLGWGPGKSSSVCDFWFELS